MTADILFTAGGAANMAVAALHVGVIFVGSRAYRYFGAGEWMADKAAQGSPLPALITVVITSLFVLFGLYGFSGAGHIPPLPWLGYGLVGIGGLYTLRGLGVVIQAVKKAPPKDQVFSLVALVIGVLYLGGCWLKWDVLFPATI